MAQHELKMKNQGNPHHVAIIMDGNGRWARRRALPRLAGHRAGIKAVREVIEAAGELGIKVLTLYAFSTENWSRPKNEVSALFKLLEDHIEREAGRLHENGIRLIVTGDVEGLPPTTAGKLKNVIDMTAANTGLTLNIALNYGSRAEIAAAARRIAQEAVSGRIEPSDIDEKTFSGYLYTKGLPDPDLLIRTSGEMRVSNFLLWQISYSEIYFTNRLWPDFGKKDLKKAVLEYQKRERRFGK